MGECDGGGYWGDDGSGDYYNEYGDQDNYFTDLPCPFCGSLLRKWNDYLVDQTHKYINKKGKDVFTCPECGVTLDATTLHVDKLCGLILLPLIEPKFELTVISPEQIYAPDDFKGAIGFTISMERLNAQIPPWYREVQSRVVYGEPEKPKKKSFFAKLFGRFFRDV